MFDIRLKSAVQSIIDLSNTIINEELDSFNYGVFTDDSSEYFLFIIGSNHLWHLFPFVSKLGNTLCDAPYIDIEYLLEIKQSTLNEIENGISRQDLVKFACQKLYENYTGISSFIYFPFFFELISQALNCVEVSSFSFDSFDNLVKQASELRSGVENALRIPEYAFHVKVLKEEVILPHCKSSVSIVNSYKDLVYCLFLDERNRKHKFKKCANCGCWFANSTNRQREYCNRVSTEGIHCGEAGKNTKYREEGVKRTYSKYYSKYKMQVNRGKLTNKAFETWNEKAKKVRKQFLNNQIKEEEALKWFEKNNLEN